MAIGKCYLKMYPQSDRFPNGSFVRWDGGIVGRTANYLSSAYGGEAANAWFLPKPDYIAWSGGAVLYSVTVHYVYEMGRSSGSHLFALKGHYASLKENVEMIIYGSGSASGEVNDRCTKESTYGYDLYPFLWDRIFGYPSGAARYGGPSCRQGTYAYGCWAAVSDFYLTIEFGLSVMSTEAVTDIKTCGGTGHGTILQLLDGNYTRRGFEYYEDGDEGNTHTVYEDDDYGVGTFSLNIIGLTENTKYYVRAFAVKGNLTVNGDWVDFTTLEPPTVTNIGAENSSVFARTILTGELTGGESAVERGFEYKIQDAEPAAEDTGTEVKETNDGGFAVGEYSLKNKELYDQQYIADNIVWWFRAYCKIANGEKFVADAWIKNLPTIETGWAITAIVISTGVYGEEGYVEGSVSVLGNYTSLFTTGSKIAIVGSTGNDGVYTVVSSSLVGDDTVIVLDEPIIDATVDGEIGVADINYNKADGLANIISGGASDLTERGFEVKYEYSGKLPSSWKFNIAGFEGELESVYVLDDLGRIIDVIWEGDLVKTALETVGLELGAYAITIGQMILGWPLANDCLIEGKNYKCKAFASNEFGTVYGDEVDFSTLARTFLSEDPPITGEFTIIKNEIIGGLPAGVTASRRGFRYGTTEAADEFDVHENGNFTDGPYSMMLVDLLLDTTYYIYAYIIVDGTIYEGDLETITTDPEGTEDEDEYPTPHYSPHGQDYREMSTKTFAEVLASQGIIDLSGGKKTLSIVNHLIQTNSDAKTIADAYLIRFKLAKTRMTVTYPTPLPFEREDTVDFSLGHVLFKENDLGVITFKEDGEGVLGFMDQITMMIKKINSVGLVKTEESMEYVAVLDLEHE